MPPWSSVIPTHLISDKATHVRTVLPLVKENHRSPSRHIKEAGYFTVDKLDCSAHGGPSDASEMVYWRNIPEDRTRTFTFSNATAEQFVTFEPDEGGFNNIRMSFETVVVLTMAMGRTLVLPPMQEMYLLGESVVSENILQREGEREINLMTSTAHLAFLCLHRTLPKGHASASPIFTRWMKLRETTRRCEQYQWNSF
jgi:hypothetical protein